MYNWKKWVWPGVITTVILTAGTAFIKTEPIQGELSSGAANELSSKHGWANLDISGRDITLSGTAPSEAAVAEASKLASDVYGVRVVRENTELIPVIKPYTLSANKNDGKLTVSGFAPSDEERANIISAAKQSSGGLEVVDDITLARGHPDNVSGINAYAIGALSGLDSGTAKISDNSISVVGAAKSIPDYQGTLDYLSNVPSGMEIASQDITPAAVSPYTFDALKSDGKVTLDGFVSSLEAKSSIGEKFASANPGFEIENNLGIAVGAPDGVDWPVSTGELPGLIGMFESGFAKINNSDMIFDGALPEGSTLAGFTSAVEGANFDGLDIIGINVTEKPAKVEETSPAEPVIPTVNPYVWGISKSETGVKLTGNVASDAERATVAFAVKSALGGAEIDDQQTLGLGKPDNLDGARTALAKGLKFLESGSASVAGTGVVVSGLAKNNNVKGLVERLITKQMPEGYDLDLAIRAPESSAEAGGQVVFVEKPPVIDPYLWSVAKDENGVSVAGNVVSDDERTSVLDSVKSALGVSEVKDEQTLGRGKPDNLDGARVAVSKGLKFLESGSASVSGTNVNVFGKAKNNNIKGLASRVITKAMPSGYDLNVFIQAPDSAAVKAGSVEYVEAPVIPTADPYIWGVSKVEGNVTVTGNVASDDERASVLDGVKSTFAGSEVTDQQTLALGKPDGFDEARTAISKGLKFLESGSAKIAGDSIAVSGAAKNNNIKKLATNVIVKGVPYAYKLDVAIRAPEAAVVTAGQVEFVAKAPNACAADVSKLIDGNVIQFETNSSDFLPDSEAVVRSLASKMNACPEISVLAEGHTDSRGSDRYNLKLSNDRAHKIKQFLLAAGIKQSRVVAKGFGETKPIDTNQTPEGRAKNRRTLISIIK